MDSRTPFTKIAEQEISTFFADNLAAFSKGDITYSEDLAEWQGQPIQWLFGVELDFAIAPMVNTTKLNALPFMAAKREGIAERIQKRIDAGVDSADVLEQLREQLVDIPHYTAVDLMLFEIHERLEDIIVPKFSRQVHQKGYYDNESSPEIQILHGTAQEIVEREERAWSVIEEVNAEYEKCGKWIEAIFVGEHLNVSANVTDAEGRSRSIFELSDEASTKLAKKMMRGVMTMLDETAIFDVETSKNRSVPHGLASFRPSAVRMSSDRFEIRTIRNRDHFEDWVNRVVASARYAVSQTDEVLDKEEFVPIAITEGSHYTNSGATKENPWGNGFAVMRILQTSPILRNEDGSLRIEPMALAFSNPGRSGEIEEELLGGKGPDLNEAAWIDIFSAITIAADGTINYQEALKEIEKHLMKLDAVDRQECLQRAEEQFAAVQFGGLFPTLASVSDNTEIINALNWWDYAEEFRAHPLSSALYQGYEEKIYREMVKSMAIETAVLTPDDDLMYCYIPYRTLSYEPEKHEEDLTEAKKHFMPGLKAGVERVESAITKMASQLEMDVEETLGVYVDLQEDVASRLEKSKLRQKDFMRKWKDNPNPDKDGYTPYHPYLNECIQGLYYEELASMLDRQIERVEFPHSHRLKPEGSYRDLAQRNRGADLASR